MTARPLGTTPPLPHRRIEEDVLCAFATANYNCDMRDQRPGVRIELRSLRTRAMMTQEELARKAGVGTRTIRDIESGRVRPQPRTMRLLLKALDLHDNDLAPLSGRLDRIAVVPRDLPRSLRAFVGRERHLDAMSAAVAGGTAVVAMHGMAGVGKTSLAVRAAHVLAPRYPDGQLFVDLHGFTHSVGPRPTLETVMTRVLRRLHTSNSALPDNIEELSSLYRSVLAERRVLLLLDNAASADQVEALLPGTSHCLTIATSRRDLSALEGAHSIPLEPPAIEEAAEMVVAGAESRISAEEATAIAERCGRLPLAIGLATARLRSRPQWRVDDLLAHLADADLLLDKLDMGHRGVAAAIRASYLELDTDHRRLLRRLGLAPGNDVDFRAAAALSDADVDRTSAMLEALVDVHLVETRAHGRYQLHDLVRLFAVRIASVEESEDVLDAAFLRLISVYLHAAYQAAARLHPSKRRFTEGAIAHDVGLPGFADQTGALAWFQTERGNLEAAVAAAERAGLLDQAWHLATAFNAFFVHTPDPGSHAAVNRIALDIARRTGDVRKEAFTLGDAGRQLVAAGRHREAISHLVRSVASKRDFGEFGDAALTLANIGILLRRSGRFAEAVEMHQAALAQAEDASDTAAAALIRTNMVVPLLRLGRFEEAERCLGAAERSLDPGDEHNRIRIKVFRASLVRERGDATQAAAAHTACLRAYREKGVTADVTETLIELGEDLLCLGHGAKAAAHLSRAVEYAVKLGDPSLERAARNVHGRALTATGDVGAAIAEHERAADLAKDHEDAFELARAQHGLADANGLRGDFDAEQLHLRRAAQAYAESGVLEAEAVTKRLDDKEDR